MALADLGPDKATVSVDGRRMTVTRVFWTYWYLAAERQAMFRRRVFGEPAPWTTDPILRSHRFTNAYRASDRVSQFLLHNVIYDDEYETRDTVLRVLLFKIFNRSETWQTLVGQFGQPTIANFDRDAYAAALEHRMRDDARLYSGAYVMPSPNLGYSRKHANHMALLKQLVNDGSIDAIAQARSLQGLYRELLRVPSFGPFLAYQYAIDLNYSPHFNFDEMDYVVAGPGATRGIAKCFFDTAGLSSAEVILAMTNAADDFLAESPIGFEDLWGRPLHLVDCQNLFCEVDKYARVAHPEIEIGGPTRIKQTFTPDDRPLQLGYPPKWELPWVANQPVEISVSSEIPTPSSPSLTTSDRM